MNAAAMATLNMGASKCIGEPIYDIIKERRFIDLIEDGADHADELVKIGRKKIIVTLSAASLGGKAVRQRDHVPGHHECPGNGNQDTQQAP